MTRKPLVLFAAISVAAWIAFPISGMFAVRADDHHTPCPSGRAVARLTGWSMNGTIPRGTAVYDEKSRMLEVTVESVSLADGQQLRVSIGDDRIGNLAALKSGASTASLTHDLKAGDRVRVLDDDRPIVSGNLKCDETVAAATPTVTPTPSPTMTPTPSPSATPTPAPTPNVEPTMSPTPMPTMTP